MYRNIWWYLHTWTLCGFRRVISSDSETSCVIWTAPRRRMASWLDFVRVSRLWKKKRRETLVIMLFSNNGPIVSILFQHPLFVHRMLCVTHCNIEFQSIFWYIYIYRKIKRNHDELLIYTRFISCKKTLSRLVNSKKIPFIATYIYKYNILACKLYHFIKLPLSLPPKHLSIIKTYLVILFSSQTIFFIYIWYQIVSPTKLFSFLFW